MADVGESMKQWRDAAGLTQEEVAASVRVSPSAPSQWENGRARPTRAKAMQLDTLYGAEGALLAELGYTLPTSAIDIAALVERVTQLEKIVVGQGKALKALGGRASKGAGKQTRQADQAKPSAQRSGPRT